MKSYNSFQVAQNQILEAVRILDLNEASRDLLIWPQKGIHVIPDILASSGGVTVFYFEMVQDSYSYF